MRSIATSHEALDRGRSIIMFAEGLSVLAWRIWHMLADQR
jgi:hypothetical protein